MRLDKFTHEHPVFYRMKHRVFGYLKTFAYHITGTKHSTEKTRNRLFAQQKRIYDNWLAGRKILDIGCGRGDFLSSICSNYGCKGVGIDVSQGMLEFASINNSLTPYIMASCDRLPFKDKSFDVAIFKGVLHHLPPDLAQLALSEAERVSCESIIIEEPAAFPSPLLRSLSRLYWRIEDHGYYYGTIADWQRIIGGRIAETISGEGLVRYVMFVKQIALDK